MPFRLTLRLVCCAVAALAALVLLAAAVTYSIIHEIAGNPF